MTQAPGSLVLSYLGLRKAIGIIGIALPFALALGKILIDGPGLQRSISAYYYTGVRDLMVGSLCAIAVFLMSYRGYEKQDSVAGKLACLFAIGVALFPTAPEIAATAQQDFISRLHYSFATLFFLILAYFCLILFKKTDPRKHKTRQKRYRNFIYTVCGYSILASIVLIGVVAHLPTDSAVLGFHPVFWLESLAILAFGVSWLVKGEAILKDNDFD